MTISDDEQTIEDLMLENERLTAALKEIAKGEGAFSLDELTFAGTSSRT